MTGPSGFLGVPTLVAGGSQILGQQFGAEVSGVLAPGTQVASVIVPGGTVGPRGAIRLDAWCKIHNDVNVGHIWTLRGDINGTEVWTYPTVALGNGSAVNWGLHLRWHIDCINLLTQARSFIHIIDQANLAGDIDTIPFAAATAARQGVAFNRRTVDWSGPVTFAVRASSSATDAGMRFQVESLTAVYLGPATPLLP